MTYDPRVVSDLPLDLPLIPSNDDRLRDHDGDEHDLRVRWVQAVGGDGDVGVVGDQGRVGGLELADGDQGEGVEGWEGVDWLEWVLAGSL